MEIKDFFDVAYPYINLNNEDEHEEIMEAKIKDIHKKLAELKLHNIINLDHEIRKQFIFLVFLDEKPNIFNIDEPNKSETFLIIHMFNKIYDNQTKEWHSNNIRYINSIFLSDNIECHNKYDWYESDKKNVIKKSTIDNDDSIDTDTDIDTDNAYSIDTDSEYHSDLDHVDFLKNITPVYNENDNIDLTIEGIFDTRYFVEDDLPYILHQESIPVNDWELLLRLKNLRNGVYFNPKDIRWQCVLNSLMSAEIGGQGKLVKYSKSKDYIKTKIMGTYIIDSKHKSIYNKIFNESISLSIQCDECSNKICDSYDGEFWHNHEYGDLCDVCYNNKMEREAMRLNYIKRQILLVGKQIVFKRAVEKTRKKLNKKKVKPLTQKKRLKLLEDINQQLQTNVSMFNNNYCSICMDLMHHDISAGKCGHCFHTKCINQIDNYECPLCRKVTSFFKLFLNEKN